MTGKFVISLDFELLWGVRDKRTVANYGDAVLGARRAIPEMLSLFARNGIRATWACVGLLFFRDRNELLDALPDDRPSYANPRFDPYASIETAVGQSEQDDPYHYGSSLIDRIAKTPGQEIGTHTFSHFYCLEEGQSIRSFRADLAAAAKVAGRRGIRLQSIVFPRNQMTNDHLAACADYGILAYRGNPRGWAYDPRAQGLQTMPVRLGRYLDSFFDLFGSQTPMLRPSENLPRNIPASRFLRPRGRLALQNRLRLDRVMAEMQNAATIGGLYHLWWHPHNFGRRTEENMQDLKVLIEHYQLLKLRYGFETVTMGELAARGLAAAG